MGFVSNFLENIKQSTSTKIKIPTAWGVSISRLTTYSWEVKIRIFLYTGLGLICRVHVPTWGSLRNAYTIHLWPLDSAADPGEVSPLVSCPRGLTLGRLTLDPERGHQRQNWWSARSDSKNRTFLQIGTQAPNYEIGHTYAEAAHASPPFFQIIV